MNNHKRRQTAICGFAAQHCDQRLQFAQAPTRRLREVLSSSNRTRNDHACLLPKQTKVS